MAELHSHGFIHKASGVAGVVLVQFCQSNDGSLGPGMVWKDIFSHQTIDDLYMRRDASGFSVPLDYFVFGMPLAQNFWQTNCGRDK